MTLLNIILKVLQVIQPTKNWSLKKKEPENSYQALRMNTRRKIDNETKIEDEANYQELDKVREKDNNYQSLNSV